MENVSNQSIWGDEGFSAILSMKSLPEIIKIISRDTSPPLWNIFEHLVLQTLGTDEIYIRGLAFTFFLGAVFFTYKIGSFLFNKRTGFLAAILTFLNPFFFSYAFEGRMYSILALGVTSSMYFFLKKMWKSYVLATLWALYSHHFAFFALFVQGIWFLYDFLFGEKKVAQKMFKAFLTIGVAYTPWLLPLYRQTKMVGGGFWLGKPDSKNFIGLVFDYLATGIRSSIKLPFIDIKISILALLLVFISLLIKNWFENYKKTFFLLSWFLIPIIATWTISQYFQSIFFNRYLLYSIPAGMLLLVSNRQKASNIVFAFLIIIFAIVDYNYFTHPDKLPFKEYASFIKQNKREGDFLINWNSKSHHLWETKYYGIPAPIYISEGAGNLPFFVGTALMEEKDIIRKIPDSAKRVGVITSGPIDEISLPGYTEVEVKTFERLKFILYEKG